MTRIPSVGEKIGCQVDQYLYDDLTLITESEGLTVSEAIKYAICAYAMLIQRDKVKASKESE